MTENIVTLKNDKLSLAVSSLGAEMQYLRTGSGKDILWHGDPEFWTGRAPILFPIVGRSPDDEIAVGDHHAPMKQHGFARRLHFSLVESSNTHCHHVLTASEATKPIYPFDFALHLSHFIEGNQLDLRATVENLSNNDMPFGLGFHPAFLWPLPGFEALDHHVRLASRTEPKRRKIVGGLLDPELIPGPFVNGDLEIMEALFSEDALIFPNSAEPLHYGPKTSGQGLHFKFHNLPDFALWKPVGAPFLCIEPWHGTASLIGDGPQIQERPNSTILPPKESAEFGYSVVVELD